MATDTGVKKTHSQIKSKLKEYQAMLKSGQSLIEFIKNDTKSIPSKQPIAINNSLVNINLNQEHSVKDTLIKQNEKSNTADDEWSKEQQGQLEAAMKA